MFYFVFPYLFNFVHSDCKLEVLRICTYHHRATLYYHLSGLLSCCLAWRLTKIPYWLYSTEYDVIPWRSYVSLFVI